MLALIDGDILPYEMGGLKDEFGDPLPFEMCWAAVQNKIENIIKAVDADDYIIYLSSPEFPTWRFKLATIQPYKGQRKSEKPLYWAKIRENIDLSYKCKIIEGIEADDAMSCLQYAAWSCDPHLCETVICTRDKDLNMVPGFHYGWEAGKCKEKPMWFQSREGGLRCFYQQLLTGDTVDNILGLFGVGEKSALVKKLADMQTEEEMYTHVHKHYSDRFGTYADQFLLENARLLWMMRTEEDLWTPPIAL